MTNLEIAAKAAFNISQVLAERVTPWNEAPEHDKEAWRIITKAALDTLTAHADYTKGKHGEEWVSVQDRLPKIDKDVLAVNDDGTFFKAQYSKAPYHREERYCWWDVGRDEAMSDSYEVTHWREIILP